MEDAVHKFAESKLFVPGRRPVRDKQLNVLSSPVIKAELEIPGE